jgi:hypothetical protein
MGQQERHGSLNVWRNSLRAKEWAVDTPRPVITTADAHGHNAVANPTQRPRKNDMNKTDRIKWSNRSKVHPALSEVKALPRLRRAMPPNCGLDSPFESQASQLMRRGAVAFGTRQINSIANGPGGSLSGATDKHPEPRKADGNVIHRGIIKAVRNAPKLEVKRR